MSLLRTWFINLVLLPGKMLHTIITKKLINRYDLKIYSINYLEIASDRSQILYDTPNTLKEKYVIALSPFVLLNSIALVFYYLSLKENNSIISFLLGYLGIACSYASFPTQDISYKLWKTTLQEIKNKELLAYLLFIPISIIALVKVLSIFSLEILFAIGLFLWLSIEINKNPFD